MTLWDARSQRRWTRWVGGAHGSMVPPVPGDWHTRRQRLKTARNCHASVGLVTTNGLAACPGLCVYPQTSVSMGGASKDARRFRNHLLCTYCLSFGTIIHAMAHCVHSANFRYCSSFCQGNCVIPKQIAVVGQLLQIRCVVYVQLYVCVSVDVWVCGWVRASPCILLQVVVFLKFCRCGAHQKPILCGATVHINDAVARVFGCTSSF